MTGNAKAAAAKFRTPPDQPKHFAGVLFERTAPDGTRHFFGFIGAAKLLLFPTAEQSSGGDPKWKLFVQNLKPGEGHKPPAFPPAIPAPLGFVSGLPADTRGQE
jgi:hypothetical protein